MIVGNFPYISNSNQYENDESFMYDFETTVLRSRQNIIVHNFYDIKDFIIKKFGVIYNYIHIIEVDLFTDPSRNNDCVDQILKSIKDYMHDNIKIKMKFAELLQPNLKEIHKDETFDEILNELMLLKEQVIFIFENFNYHAQFISDNDYHRLTKICTKKYHNKLSYVLIVDNKMDFSYESSYIQMFLSTFQVKKLPANAAIPSNNIIYNPLINKPMKIPEIYISYAWNDESEDILKNLRLALDENQIKYFVDKKDINYRGNIGEFEERLGKGDHIILIISDKFLKSKDCMYEVLQIMNKGGDISKKIYPIVLSDAMIYDPEQRVDYIKYWEEKKRNLNEKLKTIEAEYLSGLRSDIDNYSEFRKIIDGIMTTLKEMNNLTPEIHRNERFKQLINSIKEQQSIVQTQDNSRNELQGRNERSINQYGTKSIYIEKNKGDITIN
jgi:hypothetical protein